MNKKAEVYTDGACSGNPGPGGWGVTIKINNETIDLSGGEKNTTNNNMTIVRNIAYSQIQKINKKIKEEIEVDNTLLSMIDINMKNAINKIINNYKLKQQQ